MTDIVERLRAIRDGEEIERLATEIERLRRQLDTIAKHPDTPELIRQYAVGLLDNNGMPSPDFSVKP